MCAQKTGLGGFDFEPCEFFFFANIIHVHSKRQKWADARKLFFRSGILDLQMHQLDQETLNGASSFYSKSVGLLYFTRGSCNKPKPTFNWIQPKKMLHKHGFSDVSDSTDSLKLLLFDYSKLSWNRCWCNYCSPWHDCFKNASSFLWSS